MHWVGCMRSLPLLVDSTSAKKLPHCLFGAPDHVFGTPPQYQCDDQWPSDMELQPYLFDEGPANTDGHQ